MKTKRKTEADHKPWKGVSGVLENAESVDGTCVEGPKGRLGIALSLATLEQLRSTSQPTHWLLPLEDAAMVERAGSLAGEVLWLSSRQPSEVLGKLSDGFRGGWVQSGSLRISLEGDESRGGWIRVSDKSWSLEHIAREVALRWSGEPSGVGAEWPVSQTETKSFARVAA